MTTALGFTTDNPDGPNDDDEFSTEKKMASESEKGTHFYV